MDNIINFSPKRIFSPPTINTAKKAIMKCQIRTTFQKLIENPVNSQECIFMNKIELFFKKLSTKKYGFPMRKLIEHKI